MTYEFQCKTCGRITESRTNHPTKCLCGDVMRRKWAGFAVAKQFQPHFNHSVGQYVNTKAEFVDQLKRAGDRQSEITGISHEYVMKDVTDHKITDEGLDSTRKRLQDTGQVPSTKKLII